jgi:hypothetical protein
MKWRRVVDGLEAFIWGCGPNEPPKAFVSGLLKKLSFLLRPRCSSRGRLTLGIRQFSVG